MRYSIHAGLRVELSASVREHHIQVRLGPWEDECQRLDECKLDAEPYDEPILHRDGFGNPLHCLSIAGAGWRGFDPAEGLVVNDSYVRAAAGRDADDVPVERATFEGEGADPRIHWRLTVSPA
jgi:hypothetical protein